jgi:hypothetical protein
MLTSTTPSGLTSARLADSELDVAGDRDQLAEDSAGHDLSPVCSQILGITEIENVHIRADRDLGLRDAAVPGRTDGPGHGDWPHAR